jgi:serine/threonine protein kinase
MESTVESLCNQLARNRLLDGEAVRSLRGQWRGEAGTAADNVLEFRKWLTKTGSVSEFQLDMLERGYGDFLSFGEYKLQQRIGSGRMAGVYKAVHPLGQTVALKILPPSKSKHPQLLGRFLREARLAVKLDHDNVVRTFQNGIHKDMYYIVMEYLDGETLEETLQRRKRLPLSEAVPILIGALQGLDHLHEIGVVHRDLKPGNLMLVPAENAGAGDTTLKCAVKILDIGLGRALFDEGTPGVGEAAELTSDGAILGTLNYMAPEQARSAHTADIRADIYSLGCVMYEMLTGQPPFADANFARQMRRHAEEQPKPLQELVPGISPQVDFLVQKMLAKDPALRYATPGQVLKDLKALAVPVPVAKPVRPMRSYLSWLDAQPKDALPDTAPRAPQPAAAAALIPTVVVPNPFAFSHPVPVTVSAPTPMPRGAPMAVPVAAAPASPIPPAAPLPPPQAVISPSVPPAAAPANPVAAFAKVIWGHIRAYGWGKRDWISAAVGAGAILLLQGILWILRRLF